MTATQTFPLRRWLDRAYRHLARPTHSLAFIPEIDGLRFVAIAAVVGHHLNGNLEYGRAIDVGDGLAWLRALLATGNIGVQLFFAISGFILAVPFLRAARGLGPPVSLKSYYLRRLVRLEPPYLVSLAILFLWRYRTIADPWQHLGWSAIYGHGARYGLTSTLNFVAWSLEVEVQFYVTLPLLAWAMFRIDRAWLRRGLLAVVWVPLALRQHAVFGARFPHGLFLWDQLQFFIPGILLADLYVSEWQTRPPRPSRWFDVLAVCAFGAIPLVTHLTPVAGRFVIPFLLLLAYLGVFRGDLVPRVLRWRWLTVIGGMCYTIYLYHAFVMSAVFKALANLPVGGYGPRLLLIGSLAVLATLGVCTVLYAVLERPFMKVTLQSLGLKTASK